MKTKITEKQLRQLVRESLEEIANENQEDEGLWGGIKGAAKGLGQAAKGEWGKFKRGVMDKGLNNEYQGQSVGDRFKTAGKQIATAARGGDLQQELDSVAKTIQSLMDRSSMLGSFVIKSPQAYEAAQTLLNAIQMAKKGSIGGVNAAASKRYGEQKPAAPAQQQKVALEESKLDRIIRESIEKVLKNA